jgi:hypothetical protein
MGVPSAAAITAFLRPGVYPSRLPIRGGAVALADQYAAGMAQLIAARAEQMVDACMVTRGADPGQTPELDADGNVVPAAPETIWDGPCVLARFRSGGTRASAAPTTNDDASIPELRTLKVPHAAELRSGDLLTMTACAFSPGLVGQTFVVLHEDPRTYATFRSFTVRGSSWLAGP